MSLKEAMLDIASEMDKSIEDYKETLNQYGTALITSFARQIRIAVKAAGDDKPTVDTSAFLAMGTQLENKAKAIIDRQRERQAEDSVVTGDCMAFCVGGPLEGTYVPINPAMPIGAFTRLEGQIYELGVDKTLIHRPPTS